MSKYFDGEMLNGYEENPITITDLKAQLAEKNEEIEQWKSMAERSSSILDRFNYCEESVVYNTTRDQDKISFAIKQLEKVKEAINDKYQYFSKLEQQGELTYYGEGAQSICYLLLKQIENQIKELKGE